MKSGTDAVGLDHNLILTYARAEATMTPMEAIPGHTMETEDVITGVLPGDHAQINIHITLTITPHIGDHLHTEVLQLTLESTADHELDQHINQPRRPHRTIHHYPGNPTVIQTLRQTPESQ